jgi:hypothetical protein
MPDDEMTKAEPAHWKRLRPREREVVIRDLTFTRQRFEDGAESKADTVTRLTAIIDFLSSAEQLT